MGGISIIFGSAFFLIYLILLFNALVGLITFLVGLIVKITKKVKKRKSTGSIIAMIVGGVLIIPALAVTIGGGIFYQQHATSDKPIGELNYCIQNKTYGKLEKLLQEGSDPGMKTSGVTPLETAIKCDDISAMNILFQYGADANSTNTKGDSMLLVSLEETTTERCENYFDRAQLLIDHGADMTARTKGTFEKNSTTLMALADSSKYTKLTDAQIGSLADQFINAGVDINSKNDNGDTALIIACEDPKNTYLIKYLLQKGADKSIKDTSSLNGDASFYFKKSFNSHQNRLSEEEYEETLKLLE